MMRAHDKITYLLVSFLVPMSIPTTEKKKSKMGRNYGISLFLFYAECSLIILYAVMIKKHYHFKLFQDFYRDFPNLLRLSRYNFETVAFFLFLICLAATLVAGLLRCLANRCFHPTSSLFTPKQVSESLSEDIQRGNLNLQ